MEQAYLQRVKKMIGSEVTVTMDRPLGSAHPKYPDLVYPVNYGYIAGMKAPDGDDQDAYVLGVDQPLDSFSGVVIAVIVRSDDVEAKLVVAPNGMVFSDEEILEAVRFQERYFQSTLIR